LNEAGVMMVMLKMGTVSGLFKPLQEINSFKDTEDNEDVGDKFCNNPEHSKKQQSVED